MFSLGLKDFSHPLVFLETEQEVGIYKTLENPSDVDGNVP